MIRNHCAACGRAINRTDRIFEPSDGTVCQDCLARLGTGTSAKRSASAVAPDPLPSWAILPARSAHGFRQG